MRFRRGARLDPGQVTDVRGRRVGAGGLAVGGGGLGLVVLVVYLLVTVLSGNGGGLGPLGQLQGERVGQGDTPSSISQDCKTGQDANEREDCRIVAVVNSVQKFWDGVFQRSGEQYEYVDTVFFIDQVNTGCGVASSQVGPFYCPATSSSTSTSASSTSCRASARKDTVFVESYVIAHEYGHHVQDQLGSSIGSGTTRRGPRAARSAPSSRPTATRGSGPHTRSRRVSSSS